jgi:hypothetical protein
VASLPGIMVEPRPGLSAGVIALISGSTILSVNAETISPKVTSITTANRKVDNVTPQQKTLDHSALLSRGRFHDLE